MGACHTRRVCSSAALRAHATLEAAAKASEKLPGNFRVAADAALPLMRGQLVAHGPSRSRVSLARFQVQGRQNWLASIKGRLAGRCATQGVSRAFRRLFGTPMGSVRNTGLLPKKAGAPYRAHWKRRALFARRGVVRRYGLAIRDALIGARECMHARLSRVLRTRQRLERASFRTVSGVP